jgi:hypothetical protein
MPKRPLTTLGRRQLLQCTVLGAATAAIGLEGDAAQAKTSFKATKKQAGYIVRDKPATQMCAQCLYFIAPNDCVVVQGPISPLGWCNYYGD